jgi:Flp pilus assembly protein TadD
MLCLERRGLVAIALAAVILLGGCAAFRAARLYDRGSDALERGEVERAVADLERAATLAPHASEIQNHLGLAYAASGREEDALRAFRRAVELDCDNRQALHNLAAAEGRTAP